MKYGLIFLITLFVLSCKQHDGVDSHSPRFYFSNNCLIKEIYDSVGKILIKQYFNKDTIPKGPMIEYFPNGHIATWRWFQLKNKNPLCGFFYDSNGNFNNFKGDFILDAIRHPDSSVYIEIVNPPQVAAIVKIVGYEGEKNVTEDDFMPYKTDSVYWVNIGKFNFKNEYNYKVFFCVVDTAQKEILYKLSENLAIPKEKN